MAALIKRLFQKTPEIEPSKYRDVDFACIVSNETGRKETLAKLAQVQFDVVKGTGGLFNLDIASLSKKGVIPVRIFDVNLLMAKFWKKTQIILSQKNLNLLQARQQIFEVIRKNNFHGTRDNDFIENIEKDIQTGISFLSTPERFEIIHQIFVQNQFKFHDIDMRDTAKFKEFIEEPLGKQPLIWVSNIVAVTRCYRDRIQASIGCLPLHATVIYAGNCTQKYKQKMLMPGQPREKILHPPNVVFELHHGTLNNGEHVHVLVPVGLIDSDDEAEEEAKAPSSRAVGESTWV